MDSVDELLVEEILHLDRLDPSKIVQLCNRINDGKIEGGRKAVRAAKTSLFAQDLVVQLHALTLLDALASNCANIFHDFASEHVVDDLIHLIRSGLTPAANQEIAQKLIRRLGQHIPLPSGFKEQLQRFPSKDDKRAYASFPYAAVDLDFQRTCRKDVQGLLKDLTSSPQDEALHLQKWLEGFSNKLLNRADRVTAQVQGLLESAGAVELELHNVFNSFRGLSSSQFVENLVYEEDELEITNKDLKKPEQGMPSQNYEDDIVPRYKEAVTAAWGIYEQHIKKPSTSFSNSRILVPHIIGTEDFMRDNSCGLAEDRSFGFEALDSESDSERDEAAEIADAGILPEREWLDSESVADEQIGGFKPSVSTALDFKAMLEAALRSPYIPQKVDAFTNKGTNKDYWDGTSVPTIQGSMPATKISTAITTTADQIQRSVSKEGHGDFQATSFEPDFEDQVSTLMKPVPQHAEIQKLRNWKDSSSEGTTTVTSNDVLRDFHTSMMSGGLFDDENDDNDLCGSQSANISSHTRIYDASSDIGTCTIKREKERSVIDDSLIFEPDKQNSELQVVSSPKKPSLPHLDKTLPARSYTLVHDSLFANDSTSSANLKDTLPFLRKGLFEDEEDDPDTMGLFGTSNDTTTLKEINHTNFTGVTGDFKGTSSSSNSSVDVKANEMTKKTGVATGASFDFGNEAADCVSAEAGPVIKESDTGSTSSNMEGIARQKSTLSSLESILETRRELEEVSSVSVAQVIAYEEVERTHNYAGNTNRFSNLKSTHVLGEERVPDANLDNDMTSRSSANSTLDLGKNSEEASLVNGFRPGEPQQQTGNLKVLVEHSAQQVEEVTDSGLAEFSTSVVKRQNKDESGNTITNNVEPPLINMNSSREEIDEEPQNISSNWCRKLTLLQEHLNLQPEMFSSQQGWIPKTQSNISVDDSFEENKIITSQT